MSVCSMSISDDTPAQYLSLLDYVKAIPEHIIYLLMIVWKVEHEL